MPDKRCLLEGGMTEGRVNAVIAFRELASTGSVPAGMFDRKNK